MQAPDPRDYTPDLGWWGHTWRVLLSLAISATVWSQVAPWQWQHHRALFWVDLGLGLTSLALMFWRRRWPLGIAVVLNAFGLLSGSASGPTILATVSFATRRVVWQIVLVGVVGIVAAVGFDYLQPFSNDEWWVSFTFLVVITIATMAVGMYVGSRRELMWSLRDRARSNEEQQELRVASARAGERERIAREMHDVLAHRISMVSMHAGALAYRTDLPPEQVRETAALIQTKAHEALTDLRQVLGVLRDDDPVVRDRPQPTMGDLAELVTEARTAGMDVDLDVTVEPGSPEQVGRTVYRIVQEGLTNARKHALGTKVRVRVAGDAEEGVDIWVRNPVRVGAGNGPRTPGSGLGLVGLRERAELVGGRLEVTDDREGFALHGWLPWQQ